MIRILILAAVWMAGWMIGQEIKSEAKSEQIEITHPQIERVSCEWMNRKASEYARVADTTASTSDTQRNAELSTAFSELYRNCKEFNVTDSK